MNLHAIRFKSLEELKSFQICVLCNYFAVFPRWKAYNSGLVTVLFCLFRIFSNVNAVSGFDYDRLTFRPFCSNADIVVVVVKMPIKTMQGHFT